ncbi:MAG TPA: hypothetical protein VFI30_02005 [Nocardioidaceae bacterium]|nr:hypothetical protein [Nocardioidaceae bacterium]
MITSQAAEEISAWFTGRLPKDWTAVDPVITVDREEIVLLVTIDAVELPGSASESATQEAADGRVARWREDTREARIEIAAEAERRFRRKVSWGATIGGRTTMFTHLAVPAMTRLRQPQRQVLDTLVDAGVARSRSDALAWCVRLVGRHSADWLAELTEAMGKVRAVREQGPG